MEGVFWMTVIVYKAVSSEALFWNWFSEFFIEMLEQPTSITFSLQSINILAFREGFFLFFFFPLKDHHIRQNQFMFNSNNKKMLGQWELFEYDTASIIAIHGSLKYLEKQQTF